MKTTNSKNPTLSKRDIGFLRFLDKGTYSRAATLQLPEPDKLKKIIHFFDILFYLIEACYQHFQKRKTNAGRAAIKNLTSALTGKFPNVSIDFSKVILLEGTLAPPSGTMHHN